MCKWPQSLENVEFSHQVYVGEQAFGIKIKFFGLSFYEHHFI